MQARLSAGGQFAGYGRDMGFEAMREHTRPRSVWIDVSGKVPYRYGS